MDEGDQSIISLIEEKARRTGLNPEFIIAYEREVAIQELIFSLALYDYKDTVRHTQLLYNTGSLEHEHFKLIMECLEEDYKS